MIFIFVTKTTTMPKSCSSITYEVIIEESEISSEYHYLKKTIFIQHSDELEEFEIKMIANKIIEHTLDKNYKSKTIINMEITEIDTD